MSAVKISSLIYLLNKANKAYYYGESETTTIRILKFIR